MKSEYKHLLIIIITGSVIWGLFAAFQFTGLIYPDAMEYAGIARNLARGEGFSTDFFTPLSASMVEADPPLPHPNLWRAPLYPLYLSLFIKIAGTSDFAVILASGLAYLAAAVLVYFLGRALFTARIGLISALVFLSSSEVIKYGISGLTEPMATGLLTAALLAMFAWGQKSDWKIYVIGLLWGLAYLCRYNFLLFMLPAAVFLFLDNKENRFRNVLKFFAGALIAMSPWLIRNNLIANNPFFSLQRFEVGMFNYKYPGYSLYLIPDSSLGQMFWWNEAGIFWSKYYGNLVGLIKSIALPTFTGVSVVICVIFWLGLVRRLNGRVERFRYTFLAMILIQFLAMPALQNLPRLFTVFAPCWIIFAFGAIKMFQDDTGKLSGYRWKVIWAAVIIIAVLPSVTRLNKRPATGPRNVPAFQEAFAYINQNASRDEVVVADAPWMYSWYADRPCMWMPTDPAYVEYLSQGYPLNWLILSQSGIRQQELVGRWGREYAARPPVIGSFRLVHSIGNDIIIYRHE